MKQLLTSSILMAILILLPAGRTASSQEADEPATFRIGVTAGLTTFALGDLRDFTTEGIAVYKAAGVPVELERTYPPNLQAGGEVLFLGLHPLALGIGGSYTWTSAYARYGDYAGTLDLTSRVKVLYGSLIVQYAFPPISGFEPFLDLRTGIARVSLSLEETIDITNYGQLHVSSDISGNKTGFAGESTAGIRYTWGTFALSGRAGYRLSNISSMEMSITSFGENLGSGTLGFDMNISGFVGVLTMEIHF